MGRYASVKAAIIGSPITEDPIPAQGISDIRFSRPQGLLGGSLPIIRQRAWKLQSIEVWHVHH